MWPPLRHSQLLAISVSHFHLRSLPLAFLALLLFKAQCSLALALLLLASPLAPLASVFVLRERASEE